MDIPGRRSRRLLVAAALVPVAALGQQDSARARLERARGGATFLIPAASVLLPGLGQYMLDAWWDGVPFSASAALGLGLYLHGDTAAARRTELPRSPAGQQAYFGAQLYQTAGELSAYEVFHRSLPALQGEGKFRFVTHHEPVTALLTAPFDVRFLRRWTTWVELAYTATVATVEVVATKPGKVYQPYQLHDALFGTGVSLQAGIGEEALFRGWLYPVLYQTLGERFWLANSLQAGIFGALHVPQAGPYALLISGAFLYEGWLTRRNGWSIREGIFHHFWYDAVIVTVELLTQERLPAAVIMAPPLRFREPPW